MTAAAVIAVTALLALAIYWVRRGAADEADLEQRDVALRVERDRVAAMEKAAAAARADRLREFDAKARAATSAAHAAALLSSELRSRGTD